MDSLGRTRLGLWLFTAGIFGWIFPNVAQGNGANVVTDIVIVVFGVLAAVGLPRAVDGIGTGLLRTGLIGVAACQFLQNIIAAFTDLSATNAAPVFVVMLASAAVMVAALRWREDGWDGPALPWLAGGFAGFAFEPLYYLTRTILLGDGFGGYLPGTVLVATGGILSAWGFWSAQGDAGPAP